MKTRVSLKYFVSYWKTKEGKDKKRDTYESAYGLYEGWELTLNAFKNGIFPIKATQCEGHKILVTKQMLQRLSIALEQIQAGSTPGNKSNLSNSTFFGSSKIN